MLAVVWAAAQTEPGMPRLIALGERWRLLFDAFGDALVVGPADLARHYRHPWSLHDGTRVTGQVVATIATGRLAYAYGEVLAAPGGGRLL
jgi:hypothetical protein